MMRFGIIGCGRIGAVHAKSIAGMKDANTIAVSDPFAESANRLANLFGAQVRSSEEIIASGDIDAVVIATPQQPITI